MLFGVPPLIALYISLITAARFGTSKFAGEMVKLVGRQLNNNYLSFNTKVFELNLNHHLIADEKDINNNCTLIKN